MAEKYVSAAAGGGGDGSSGSPWTLAEGFTNGESGDRINIRSNGGTYTLTSAVTCGNSGDSAGAITFEGCTSTAGDGGQPTITSATNSVTLVALAGKNNITFRSLKFTHTAGTRGPAIQATSDTANQITIDNCWFDGVLRAVDADFVGTFTIQGLQIGNTLIENCTDIGVYSASTFIFSSIIRNCTNEGFRHANMLGAVVIVDSLIYGNGSHGVYDSRTGSGSNQNSPYTLLNNVFHDNGGNGVYLVWSASTFSWTGVLHANNIYTLNGSGGGGGYGFKLDMPVGTGSGGIVAYNNCYGGGSSANVSGARSGMTAGVNEVTLSTDPFVDAPNGNFALNNASGGGALLRSAGFPGAFPGGLTTGYLDIGAAQHQDSGGGGGGGGGDQGLIIQARQMIPY